MFDRMVHASYGPILSALALSLASTPVVAAAIASATVSPSAPSQPDFPPPLGLLQAVPIALVAVVAGGLLGGAVGGTMVRRSPLVAYLLAVSVAWPVAIATLPILPGLRGDPFVAVIVCIDSCAAEIRAGDPLAGLSAYATAIQLGVLFIVPVGIAIVIGLLGWYAARRRVPALAALLGVGAIASLNIISVSEGGLAFLCLIIGTVVWVAPYWYGRGVGRARADGSVTGPMDREH